MRRAALEALCLQQAPEQATALLVLLRSYGSNDASQLALNLIGLHGYSFPDTAIAECVICCEHHPFRIGDMGKSKYDHVITHFPTERMALFLNVLTTSMSSPEPVSPDQQKSDLADLVMQLIGRYLKKNCLISVNFGVGCIFLPFAVLSPHGRGDSPSLAGR